MKASERRLTFFSLSNKYVCNVLTLLHAMRNNRGQGIVTWQEVLPKLS